ncbi:MAG: helix-turn-helix transcriptional regulator, partial [Oscillospiraceae bacterium]|nr:helix-turn-helix transcriptional regulator [Oscillospiraceae bacterium]
YHMKNAPAALEALGRAYEEAEDIVTPFAELGKDMRTLASRALRESGIPAGWLETVRRKASAFAKFQSAMVSEHTRRRGASLSAREHEVLSDLCRGLSRAEIAAKQSLSVNTVNSVTANVFHKLGAGNTADAIRIAAEEGFI